jgi:hypothetical protein
MFLILDYAYMIMKQREGRKLLVVDEAWSLLSHTEEASYLFEIVKTCRKFNMGLLLITQDVADLVNSNAGHAVLANSSYTFLLRQKPAIIDSVVKTFHLSNPEKEYLLTATQGKGILILDNDHQELSVIASEKEHALITTNPNEATQKPVEDERPDINITLDAKRGLYYGRNLRFEEKNYLSNLGYKPGMFVPIGKDRQEECWVQENSVEGLEHTFVVQNIKEHLAKYTTDVSVNLSVGADLVFKDRQGRNVAIEVETGKQYQKKRFAFTKKFHELAQQYPRLYVVLTQVEFKRQYQKTLKKDIYLRKDVPSLLASIFDHPIRGGPRVGKRAR